MLKLEKESNSRNVSVIKDALGHNVVMINDIIFRGNRGINWIDVEEYLRQYVGEFYTIAETNEVVYIGTDLPDEYAHSEYTHILKGANEKAKANAAQGLPELIIIATTWNIQIIQRLSIKRMQSTAGINTNRDLHYRYLQVMGK